LNAYLRPWQTSHTPQQPTFQVGAPAEFNLGSLGGAASDRLH
jgi:hypothetical protein